MNYLVTGGAGFIGSNLVETLLSRDETVVVLDNLATGHMSNIEPFMSNPRFSFIKGSVTNPDDCARACDGVDYVLHQAAYISVPGSVENPVLTTETNVTGTMNVFCAARDAGVKSVVWASSTAVYGNAEVLPNVETMPLNPLSPYAASKAAGEMYARAFSEVYGMNIICLRYFNVFGQRQDPASQYAAAIPLFITRLLSGESVTIFGDGGQTRDFVHIDNVVQANLRAAAESQSEAAGGAFNIGAGTETSINELYDIIAAELGVEKTPRYAAPRTGDVRHSLADISAARKGFGYDPEVDVREGLKRTIAWYLETFA